MCTNVNHPMGPTNDVEIDIMTATMFYTDEGCYKLLAMFVVTG